MMPDMMNRGQTTIYMKYKRKDLKWYKKLWNFVTGHKDRNWHWQPISGYSGVNYNDKD